MMRVILGVRGCGKTTRLRAMMGEGDVYVDGEAGEPFPCDIAGRRVLVDEPQGIAGWEREVQRLCDEGCEVVVASSSLHSVPEGAACELMGAPTFGEWLSLRGLGEMDETPGVRPRVAQGMLDEYLAYGGLAELAGEGGGRERHRAYCERLFSAIVTRDVLGRGTAGGRRQLSSYDLVQKICEFLAGCVGSATSANGMVRLFEGQGVRLANDTAGVYVDELCRSQLFWAVPRYDIVAKKPLKTLGRHYIADNGLLSFLTGYVDDAGARQRALRNAIYLAALRNGVDVYVGKFRKEEVDFMFEREGRRAYVQVAYSLEDAVVADEALRPLRRIPDPCPKIAVVGRGEYPERIDGVRIVPAEELLLSPASWVS